MGSYRMASWAKLSNTSIAKKKQGEGTTVSQLKIDLFIISTFEA